ncbi:hypothetical protein BKA57DRAFT_501221 [Linnemannia elongata]|nr:hypothetical protein BKA57DRAFT_501221 [Linnemannia elongata]
MAGSTSVSVTTATASWARVEDDISETPRLPQGEQRQEVNAKSGPPVNITPMPCHYHQATAFIASARPLIFHLFPILAQTRPQAILLSLIQSTQCRTLRTEDQPGKTVLIQRHLLTST